MWSALRNLRVTVLRRLRIRTGPKNVAKGTSGPVYQAIGGSVNVTYNTVDAAQIPELATEIAKQLGGQYVALPSAQPQPPMLTAPAPKVLADVVIPLGTKLAIIKAYDLDGGRAHLTFEVHNKDTASISVTGARLFLNDVALTSKQFFENTGGVRVPRTDMQFPLVVAAGATAVLNVEFENVRAGPAFANGLAGTLQVEIGSDVVEARFESLSEPRLIGVLMDVQQWAYQHQSAAAFGLPIIEANGA